jgi:hypothetical protein
MKKSLVFAALLIAMTGTANAHHPEYGEGWRVWSDGVVGAPEIDPSWAIAGLTLLAGGLAVLRGRRQR